jgi:hypothetical protein
VLPILRVAARAMKLQALPFSIASSWSQFPQGFMARFRIVIPAGVAPGVKVTEFPKKAFVLPRPPWYK